MTRREALRPSMAERIADYIRARGPYGAAINADHANPTPETVAALLAAYNAFHAAKTLLHVHPPATMQEAGERLAFLYSFDGPFDGVCPSNEEIALLITSYERA